MVALLLLIALPASAHDAQHPEWTPWLMEQRNQSGAACCDGEDVVRLSDSEWRTTGDHYEVWHNGGWMAVPDSAMTKSHDNIADGALLWMWQGKVQCFKPGTFY